MTFVLNAFPLWSHGFSPVWVRWCHESTPSWVNAFPHWSHAYGFSPVWMRLCTVRSHAWANAFPHCSHIWLLTRMDDIALILWHHLTYYMPSHNLTFFHNNLCTLSLFYHPRPICPSISVSVLWDLRLCGIPVEPHQHLHDRNSGGRQVSWAWKTVCHTLHIVDCPVHILQWECETEMCKIYFRLPRIHPCKAVTFVRTLFVVSQTSYQLQMKCLEMQKQECVKFTSDRSTAKVALQLKCLEMQRDNFLKIYTPDNRV